MLTLTTPVAIPNTTKIRLKNPQWDDDNGVLTCAAEVQGAGGRVYAVFSVSMSNGPCQGVRATASPVTFTDQWQAFAYVDATGYTDAVAAFTGASMAAKIKGLESAMVAAGGLPAGTVA